MVSRKTLKRLEQLNRGSLKLCPGINRLEDPPEPNYGSPDSIREQALEILGTKTKSISFEEAVPDTVIQTDAGEFSLLKKWLPDFHEGARSIIDSFPTVLKTLGLKLGNSHYSSVLSAIGSTHPSRVLFLDIETCGLSASPLFLIGCAYFTGENIALVQLFARDLSEERPLLSFFASMFSQYDVLVSFNGKSFDLPFILNRGYENGIHIPADIVHIDLLHEIRHHYRTELPNFKLQTFERHVLNRKRSGDIPGDKIPRVYRDFIQSGNAGCILPILHHNVLDIITMIEMIYSLSGEVCHLKDLRAE